MKNKTEKGKRDAKREKKELYGAFSNVLYVVKDIYIHVKKLFFFLVLSAFCGAAVPLAGIYLPKAAVDLAREKAGKGEIFALLGAAILALILVSAVKGASQSSVNGMYYDMRMMYMRRIFSKSLSIRYDRLEGGEGQSLYWKARDAVLEGDITELVERITEVAVNALNLTSFSLIIARLNPLMIVFLAVLSAVTYVFMKRGSEIWKSVSKERSKVSKQQFVLAERSCDAQSGKDIRLYGMKNIFLNKQIELSKKATSLYNKQRMGYIQEHFATMIVNILRDAVAYTYLIYSAAHGRLEPGDFVLYFGAIAGFAGWVNGVTWKIDQIRRANFSVCYLREFLEYEEEKIEAPQTPKGTVIEFKNVSFSYDGKTDVLKDFNLKIEKGEHVALVGVNGAGKSTIVKLMCGFYAPTKGSVTIGGAEASQIEPEERFRLIAAVFQEVCILPHSIAENVSMKEAALTDTEKVRESLKKAGLGQYAENIRAPLTRAVNDEGLDLSGGEAQKLMMARAVYKDAPILILDEPTAALDTIAESETYESFHSLSLGKSALYISHRLAGTRFCDRIIFLENGCVTESGTHDELMKKGGSYANMFELQSLYYKKGADER